MLWWTALKIQWQKSVRFTLNASLVAPWLSRYYCWYSPQSYYLWHNFLCWNFIEYLYLEQKKNSISGWLSKFLELAQIWADSSWRFFDFLKWNCCGNFNTQTCLQNWPIPWRRFGGYSRKISYSYDTGTKVLSIKSGNSVTKHWLNTFLHYNLK